MTVVIKIDVDSNKVWVRDLVNALKETVYTECGEYINLISVSENEEENQNVQRG